MNRSRGSADRRHGQRYQWFAAAGREGGFGRPVGIDRKDGGGGPALAHPHPETGRPGGCLVRAPVVAVVPDERFIYAGNPTVGTVSRVDLERGEVTGSYAAGAEPHGVDLSDDGRLLYVSSKGDDKLLAFNLASGEQRSVSLTPAPYHVSTIRGTGKLYVSSRKSPKIWVLDQQSLAVRGEIAIRGEGHEMGVVNR